MKRIVAMVFLVTITAHANAQPVVGVGLMRLTDSFHNLNALYISGGYRFDTPISNVSIIPEVRVGKGVFTSSGITIPHTMQLPSSLPVAYRLNHLYGLNLRVELDGERTYAFVSPGYIHTRISSSNGDTADSSHVGWEIGVGARLVDNLAIEASLGGYFDRVWGVSLRYTL